MNLYLFTVRGAKQFEKNGRVFYYTYNAFVGFGV